MRKRIFKKSTVADIKAMIIMFVIAYILTEIMFRLNGTARFFT